MNTLFKTAFRKRLLGATNASPVVGAALRFLTKLTGLQVQQLQNLDLSIEDAMDSLLDELSKAANDSDREELSRAYWGFYSILTGTLGNFSFEGFGSEAMQRLGRIIVEEVASVVTFNYDTILEEAIGLAAGRDAGVSVSAEYRAYLNALYNRWGGEPREPPPFKDFAESNWRREQAYGVRFDEIAVTMVGPGRTVSAEEYYPLATPNRLNIPFLKMHGSLNWFRYTGQPVIPPGHGAPTPDVSKAGRLILDREFLRVGDMPMRDLQYITPVIITPNRLKQEAIRQYPFSAVWDAAAERLSEARRIVVLGYSLGDAHTKEFLQDRVDLSGLEELVIVNPSTRRAREISEALGTKRPAWNKATTETYVWTHSLRSRY